MNTKLVPVVLFTSLFTSLFTLDAFAQAPAAPTNATAVPNYGTKRIRVSWVDKANDELGFEVLRKVDGGAAAVVATPGANADEYVDADVDDAKEYEYFVRSQNAAGKSADVPAGKQNIKIVWPVPASHEVLHNWNDTIGAAGIGNGGTEATGFHRGVDIQRKPGGAGGDDVVAARGGTVSTTKAGPDGYVIVIVTIGNTTIFDEYNHLKGTMPANGEVVFAGKKIAELDTAGFNGIHFVEHVHFDFTTTLFGNVVEQHPLSIFKSDDDKDPGKKKPALKDHATPADGTWKWRKQGTTDSVNYEAAKPLTGDVDLIAELSDELGTAPDQVPAFLGYWIEPPADHDGIRFAAVKTKDKQYVLYDGFRTYIANGTTAHMKKIVDETQNLKETIKEGTEVYCWENYKHFIVTNTTGSSGKKTDVSDTAHWNTDAKDVADVKPDSDAANFAGKANATKATDARFPDGIYKIHVIAKDLIQSADLTVDMRVENFAPIVVKAEPAGEVPVTQAPVAGTVIFNEAMDTSIDAATLLAVDNNATIDSPAWAAPNKLTFKVKGLVKGKRYDVTVKALAKDAPGTPGGRKLDGNKDGTEGDDFKFGFTVKKN